ncbi:MAG: crossover junction endodeoxyribonuclease RuvC [Patescibacteria group bacterium]
MRILGIDPGYDRCGLAVVEKNKGKDTLLFSACIPTDRKQTIAERLFDIEKQIQEVIDSHRPEAVALEKLFFNTNQKTAGAVGEARGMILSKSAENSLPVFEFTPAQIKVAITGYGKSDKKQMIFMLPKLVSIQKEIKYDDEYDAIAVALTALVSIKSV